MRKKERPEQLTLGQFIGNKMKRQRRDIEESEEILDSYEKESAIKFWEAKQRELVTSVVDYNLSTLSELVIGQVIDLSPEYQRRFRWDHARQSKLIESFLMNVPVPPIFLNEDRYGKYSVIDGKQRLSAVTEFFRGRLRLCDLEIFPDINGMSFDDLPNELRNVLRTRPTLRAIIILKQSDARIKFEVFQRLNTGGIRLNPQEIRNSAYTGPLNDLILELSEHPLFHKLLGVKKKATSSIYQEMRDVEFVLRFFTFKDNWATITGIKRRMDKFMQENQFVPKDQVQILRSGFLSAIENVEIAFGEYAFRRWLPEKNQWKNQLLAALYDAEIFACSKFAKEEIENKQEQLVKGLKALFQDEAFRDSIDVGTNSPARFKVRISAVFNMMSEVIGT